MSDFHEVQFPTNISYGSEGGPEFSTEVIELAGGKEVRNANWAYSRERWNVAYGINTEVLLTALRDFFYARKGKAIGFRFKNPDDYSATSQNLGTGDASETDFQIVKHYTDAGGTYTRKISKPVAGTVAVYLDDVPQGAGWSVDTTTGIITFASPPGSGVVVTADYEFDVPVRFDVDHLPVNLATYEARAADVPVIELKL